MSSTRIQQAQLVLSVPFQQQIMGSLLALSSFVINAKAGTAINYSTSSYASSGATAMQYAIKIVLEAL
jgi:hypothetical protein